MEGESQEATLVIIPVVLVPGDVLAAHEGGAPQQGALPPPLQHVAVEACEVVLCGLQSIPVEPRHLRVVAVPVVVAASGGTVLVAGHYHGGALRHQQGNHEVPHLPPAQRQHTLVTGVALDSTVPAEVVVGAVTVALPVGIVVLVVVRAQVVQSEAVMCHDKVDALIRSPVVVVVQVSGAGNAGGDGLLHAAVPLHELPEVIAELAVPLAPHVPVGESADLVHAAVPRLCQKMHLAQHGVFGDGAHNGR
mmetsp:Transcript_7418/g.21926  ORF Transcript_7418/g.21926 Transcript_7418/m.21926 type:complete len:249 (+) Transcript_7418:1433-2179(+)